MELFAFCPLPLERLALAGLLLLSSGWMPAATPPVQKCDSPSSTDSVMQLRYRTTSVLCGDLNNADRTNENRGYTEKYFSLKSRGSDFENYFQPANWQVIKKYGDGGVDVTGAPNTILVEGANTVKVEAAPRRLTVVKIVIPAEGYVAFDWSKVGGSTFFSSAIAAGDDTFNLIPSPETQGSRYFSPLLQAGDLFTIQLDARRTSDESGLRLENFRFFTNAVGLISREWTDEEGQKVIQLISVERPQLSDIIIPGETRSFVAPLEKWREITHPEHTGYPVVDRDGDSRTLDDQEPVDKTNCGFEVSWSDELEIEDDTTWLIREWRIRDVANDNLMTSIQKIRLYEPKEITGEQITYTQE